MSNFIEGFMAMGTISMDVVTLWRMHFTLAKAESLAKSISIVTRYGHDLNKWAVCGRFLNYKYN